MPIVKESVSDVSNRDISKVRIVSALSELLEEKAFRAITVRDICDKAGVSRQTFYRHFENKYDVAQWYWQQTASKHLLRVGRDLTWRDSLQKSFELGAEYLDFFAEASLDGAYESCEEFGRRCRAESLKSTVVDYLGLPLTEELEFQIDFFAQGEARMVRNAVRSSKPFDAERFARLLELCVPQQLHDLLDIVSR